MPSRKRPMAGRGAIRSKSRLAVIRKIREINEDLAGYNDLINSDAGKLESHTVEERSLFI